MRSYPTPDQVSEDLGDKVLEAISRTVFLARNDLTEYRRLRPAWVSAQTERGLAAWIHDREWFHLVSVLADVPGVSIRDAEPVREVFVGLHHRLRVKRHHWDGRVSTYPTAEALLFMAQPGEQEVLDGMHLHHLLAGYSWDKETRDIIGPVLSLRDGINKPIWLIDLPPFQQSGGASPLPFPASPAPTRPTIDTTRLQAGQSREASE